MQVLPILVQVTDGARVSVLTIDVLLDRAIPANILSVRQRAALSIFSGVLADIRRQTAVDLANASVVCRSDVDIGIVSVRLLVYPIQYRCQHQTDRLPKCWLNLYGGLPSNVAS